MRENYQFNFLPNFGKVVVILSIIPAASCFAQRSFNLLQKPKTYLRSTRDQDHLALLRIERGYSNRVDTKKVIDGYELRKGSSKLFC